MPAALQGRGCMEAADTRIVDSNAFARRLALETRGEQTTNRLRLFLSVVFSVAVITSYLSGSLGETIGFFVTGVALYVSTFIVSAALTRLKLYRPIVKYMLLALEIAALFIVNYSYLRQKDPRLWLSAVETCGVEINLLTSPPAPVRTPAEYRQPRG